MNPSNQLRFAVNDRINDAEVRPSHVPLVLLGEFQKDVSEFLKRASVVERWQSVVQKNPHRRYSVEDQSAQVSFSIDSTSNFRRIEDAWVHVEKYLHGIVVDMGGSAKANVHLKLDNGQTLTIASTQDLLARGEQNRLYRPALLHVAAEENLLTRELADGFDSCALRLDGQKGIEAFI